MKKHKHKKSKTIFTILPLTYRGKIYWLRWVVITKHFNGYNFITTSVVYLN